MLTVRSMVEPVLREKTPGGFFFVPVNDSFEAPNQISTLFDTGFNFEKKKCFSTANFQPGAILSFLCLDGHTA